MKISDLSIDKIFDLTIQPRGETRARGRVAAVKYYSEFGSKSTIQPEKPSTGAGKGSSGYEKDKT